MASLSETVSVTAVYPGELSGAVVFGRDAGGRIHHFIANGTAMFGMPAVGEVWTFHGDAEDHPKYGRQVRVVSCHADRPSGKLLVNYLAHGPALKGTGIGLRKAERLWDAFGEELYSILSRKDVSKLSLVLTEETALKLAAAWKDTGEEVDVVRFLARHGFDLRLANRVRDVWPGNAVEKLQENPYRMLAFASWKKVDAISESLGVRKDDPRRLVASVEAILYKRLDAKHTLTPHDLVVRGVSAALGGSNKMLAVTAVERAVGEYAVVPLEDGYQPRGAAFMEKFVADRFRMMLSAPENRQPGLFSDKLGDVVAESIMGFEESHGGTLNVEQRAGIEMAVGNRLSVLTGGAGVGKTTVLRIVNEVCERVGTPVIQMALSGRAAQRLREATGRDALTIARFLHQAGAGKLDLGGEPLLLIDEASMLDLPLTYGIVRAVPERTRLLLVGDSYQLPPIGFGLVFHVLNKSRSVPKVELVHVHRQALSSGIPQIASDVRRGIPPQLPAFAGAEPGVSFVEADAYRMMDGIDHVMAGLKDCEDVQILGATKHGNCGVVNINATFHAINSAGRKSVAGWSFAEGDPVIYLRNDYERELWNGSLGRIDAVNVGGGQTPNTSLSCTFDGAAHTVEVKDFDKIALAYAITVHKAQGSQFERVVVPIIKSRLLDRTLIYTALTRGVEQVVFVGDRTAFNNAIRSPIGAQERMVGFSV